MSAAVRSTEGSPVSPAPLMNILAAGASLNDGQRRIDHAALQAQVAELARTLRDQGIRVLATVMDNSPAWVVADLAAAQAGLVHVPLPLFFTPAQMAHALRAAGVDGFLFAGQDAIAALEGLHKSLAQG